MGEQWRDIRIPGCERCAGYYQVSSTDPPQVRSLEQVVHQRTGQPYTVRPRILLPFRQKGFLRVTLACHGRKHGAYVHLLQREAWGEQYGAAA